MLFHLLVYCCLCVRFVLLGMSLLNGNRYYQSFLKAFYVTFQVLTGENWDGILYELFPMNETSFYSGIENLTIMIKCVPDLLILNLMMN